MLGYVTGMLAVIAAIPPAYYFLGANAAWAVSTLGTIGVQVAILVYITFWHSRKRWPGVSAFTRFSRVVTFYRD